MPDFVPPKSKDSSTPLKIETAKEPPKEVIDMTFSTENMPHNGSVTAPIQLPTVKKEEPKKDETSSVQPQDEKVLDKVSTSDDKTAPTSSVLKPPASKEAAKDKKADTTKSGAAKEPETVRQIAPPDKTQKKERDYAGFTNEETAVLKQMSNDAFEYASKVIKENKELSKLKDASFLQHPDAYTLSPDYQKTVQEINQAGTESQAWRQALILCEEGKPFTIPKGYNPKTGELIMSEPIEPTAAYKVELANILTNVTGMQQQLKGKLDGMSNQFKQRTTADRQILEQERQRRFGWVAKPEMLDWTVTTQTGAEVPIKQIKEDFKNIWPPYDRGTPGVEVASDLMVAIIILEGELRQALAGKSTVEAKIDEVKRGEPSSNAVERQVGEAIGGVKEFSLAGMPR